MRQLTLPPNSAEWRRLCRLSLVVAARAYEINAKREWGDYSDECAASAGVPARELPGSAEPAPASPAQLLPQPANASDPGPVALAASPLMSVSCAAFFASQPRWSTKYRKQVDVALLKFVSLMGDLPVGQITRSLADTLRGLLQAMPRPDFSARASTPVCPRPSH